MLRVRNEHSQAFKGRYSPENTPWGVEIAECQYWPHVRTVDVVGPPQIGKTFHVCELPTLYDLCEARETVFYMNGSADNALNIWTARWLKTLSVDPVLRQQLLERMDAGRWAERHFADGGLLYSAGPESAVGLSQREARIVRCSELEKTRAAIGNEASSYALARDRAAAYPATHLITSDCTVTVRDGLSWVRFRQGDRSRPFVPCPACGHYAMPAHERHLEEPDLELTLETVHLLEIAAISSATPSAAEEQARLVCKRCEHAFTTKEFRSSLRAVVWVPIGCHIIRHDDVKLTPIPRVEWLDELRTWSGWQLAQPDVVEGIKDPESPPACKGPRLPNGVELGWTPEAQPSETLPAFRPDPRKASSRSFWTWRLLSPKYTIGQVAREIVASDLGALTGDLIDDQKNCSQKCLVLPYTPKMIGDESDLSIDTVLLTVSSLPRGRAPEFNIALTAGVDINEDAVRAVKRAWTREGETYLVDHVTEWTGLVQFKKELGKRLDRRDARFLATRTQAIYAALDRVWVWISAGARDAANNPVSVDMTYVDAGAEWADEIYAWCGNKSFHCLRPIKGFGVGSRLLRRGGLTGQWTDSCEKAAAECVDGRGRPLRHQYYDPKDKRMLMRLHADHWKREVQNGIKIASLRAKALQMNVGESVAIKPWFFVHADVSRNDDYVSQVIAERWEEFLHPKTGKREMGWKEYQDANHFLDCEAYAFAAAGAVGITAGNPSILQTSANSQTTAAPAPAGVRVPEIPSQFRRERF
jgi:phage terminase large subunit GpA-like protein